MKISSYIYDILEKLWNRHWTHRRLVDLLLIVFVGSLVVIQLKREGFLPQELAELVPRSHFYAIQVTFELLLFYEALGLIFGLSRSVANTVGKQFEILGLILIRHAFEEFVHFEEPISWSEVSETLIPIAWNGLGGLAIFGLLGAFHRVQKHQRVTLDDFDQSSFLVAKKLIALIILVGFGLILGRDLSIQLSSSSNLQIFEEFYTLLIFGDVLLVLVSMRYTTNFRIIFRNFGFALATVSIRLALTAPLGYDVMLGVSGLVYALVVSVLYNVHREAWAGQGTNQIIMHPGDHSSEEPKGHDVTKTKVDSSQHSVEHRLSGAHQD